MNGKRKPFSILPMVPFMTISTAAREKFKNWIFTYNQGTFLGAALELYKITGEKGYLNDAKKAGLYVEQPD